MVMQKSVLTNNKYFVIFTYLLFKVSIESPLKLLSAESAVFKTGFARHTILKASDSVMHAFPAMIKNLTISKPKEQKKKICLALT